MRSAAQHERPNPAARERAGREPQHCSSPTTKPCRSPLRANTATRPTMIQSSVVTSASRFVLRGILMARADASRRALASPPTAGTRRPRRHRVAVRGDGRRRTPGRRPPRRRALREGLARGRLHDDARAADTGSTDRHQRRGIRGRIQGGGRDGDRRRSFGGRRAAEVGRRLPAAGHGQNTHLRPHQRVRATADDRPRRQRSGRLDGEHGVSGTRAR